MKKMFIVLAVIALGAIVFAVLSFGGLLPSVIKEDPIDIPGSERFEEIELNPPSDYIGSLKEIIKNDPDPDVRVQGVFTLTRIAIRREETDQVIPFLKDLAYNEQEDRVRNAAYSNIDFIRLQNPPASRGLLNVSIEGIIAKGKTITIVTDIGSKNDTPHAIVGINRFKSGLYPSTEPVLRTTLKAGESRRVRFDIILNETGSYEIPVTLLLSWDRIDDEYVTKYINLTVRETSGDYTFFEDDME